MIVKELKSNIAGGSACLYKLNDKYYRISSIPHAPDHGGPETLAFICDEDGDVEDWCEVAGGRYMSREETITELTSDGEKPGQSNVTDLFSALDVIMNPPPASYYNK